MKRRAFFANAAGAAAGMFAPVRRALADDAALPRDHELTLDCLEARPCREDSVPLPWRVVPQARAAIAAPLRVRAWFITDTGIEAFDIASFGRVGASQRLRFVADPRRLAGFELGRGVRLDDCAAAAACLAPRPGDRWIGPGRYCLTLRQSARVVAVVDLDVGSAIA
jgi:hypothetical protein